MKPYLAKGHERPLTFLRYNRQGDLLFSSAKDNHPTVWFSENGERLGTYEGHNGTVWCLDVTFDSKRLLTGSGDQVRRRKGERERAMAAVKSVARRQLDRLGKERKKESFERIIYWERETSVRAPGDEDFRVGLSKCRNL